MWNPWITEPNIKCDSGASNPPKSHLVKNEPCHPFQLHLEWMSNIRIWQQYRGFFLRSTGTNYHSNLFKSKRKIKRMSLLRAYWKSFVVGRIHSAKALHLEKEKTHFVTSFGPSCRPQLTKRREFDDMKLICACGWYSKWNLAYQLWSPAAPWPWVRMRRAAVQSALCPDQNRDFTAPNIRCLKIDCAGDSPIWTT